MADALTPEQELEAAKADLARAEADIEAQQASAAAPAPTVAPDTPAPVTDDPAVTGAPSRSDAIAAIIRNGLSNGPIAQSQATWDHLNTRLPEIVAAILEA
jgi:hypothetical protein